MVVDDIFNVLCEYSIHCKILANKSDGDLKTYWSAKATRFMGLAEAYKQNYTGLVDKNVVYSDEELMDAITSVLYDWKIQKDHGQFDNESYERMENLTKRINKIRMDYMAHKVNEEIGGRKVV